MGRVGNFTALADWAENNIRGFDYRSISDIANELLERQETGLVALKRPAAAYKAAKLVSDVPEDMGDWVAENESKYYANHTRHSLYKALQDRQRKYRAEIKDRREEGNRNTLLSQGTAWDFVEAELIACNAPKRVINHMRAAFGIVED